MKILALAVVALFALVMIYATGDLPVPGEEGSAAADHVSPFYIENAVEDSHTPNIVTAVLADYRSFDTLGETLVIFTASLACILILARRQEHD